MVFSTIDPLHPVFALLVVFTALATSAVLARVFGVRPAQGRCASIDGLRGFLALGVFIQHAGIWYLFLTEGGFGIGEHQLFRHFGEASVGAFFMITALLFTRKVMQGRREGIDWTGIYIGRAMRLWPLYLLVLAVMLVVIFHADGWKVTESFGQLTRHVLTWVFFTVDGTPRINGFADTDRMISGVTWTLPYEWFFYFGLPMLAILLRIRSGWLLAMLGAVICVGLMETIPHFHLTKLAYFMGGIAAALCLDWPWLVTRLRGTLGGTISIVCIVSAVALFTTAYRLPPAALFTLAFIPIACGNTLFGLLSRPSCRALGELTYGVYLWHGLALYGLFQAGSHPVAHVSPVAFWGIVVLATPPLLLLCQLTYHGVEKPFIDAAPTVAGWLRARRATPAASVPATSSKT